MLQRVVHRYALTGGPRRISFVVGTGVISPTPGGAHRDRRWRRRWHLVEVTPQEPQPDFIPPRTSRPASIAG